MDNLDKVYRVLFWIFAWLVACAVTMIALMPFIVSLYETWGDPPHFRREVAELSWYYSGGLGLSCVAVLVGWYLLVVRRNRGGWRSWLVIPATLLMLASLARFVYVHQVLSSS